MARVDQGLEQVTPGDLMMDPGDSEERGGLSADARALADSGLLTLDERFNGAWAARPTRAGRDEWASFVSRRDDAVERARQLRNDYLRWIYTQTRRGGFAVADGFLDSGVTYLGRPYTLDDLMQAGKWLKERDFIHGPGAAQRPDPLRPAPTPKGEDWVEARRDVHEAPHSSGGTSYTFHGPAQVAHGNQNVTQVQQNDQVRDDARRIATALQQLADTESGESRAELASLAGDLRSEADGSARPKRLKEIGSKALDVLGSGAGGALGGFVSTSLTTFLGTLM